MKTMNKNTETHGRRSNKTPDSVNEVYKLIVEEKQTIQRIIGRIEQSVEAIKATRSLVDRKII